MDRFALIAARLRADGLSALLLTGEYNRFYATGFHAYGGDGVALIAADGRAWYLTDARYTEAAARAIPAAVQLEIGGGRGYAAVLKELFETERFPRLGFEDASMSVQEFKAYQKALGDGVEFVGWSEALSAIRSSKDADEQRRMIAAQRVAERAFTELLNEIRAGVSEKEIAARLQYWMLHFGATDKSFDPIVASGANGSMPHAVPTEKLLKPGEFVTIDFGCVYEGYCSDTTRTFAIESVTDEMAFAYDAVLRAQKAGIAAARAGVTGKEIDAAARAVLSDAGLGQYFTHSFGHGVGVEIHEAPNAAPRFDKPLPAGAVISAEPGVYIPGRFGLRIEDVIILNETGCTDITELPKDLLIL